MYPGHLEKERGGGGGERGGEGEKGGGRGGEKIGEVGGICSSSYVPPRFMVRTPLCGRKGAKIQPSTELTTVKGHLSLTASETS